MVNSDQPSTFASRLESAVKKAGGVIPLARKSNVSKSTIESWRRGEADPRLSNVIALAAAAGVDFYWLATGQEQNIHMSLADLQHAIEDRDVAHVPRYDVALSAGHGSFVEHAKMLDLVPFTRDFFNGRLGRGPDGMVIVDARGDSMEPTIGDRDQVMIDTSDTQMTPAIWAFALDDAVLVKRLQQTPQGIEIVSDNPVYGRQLVEPSRQDGFRLIGRVVWVGRVL